MALTNVIANIILDLYDHDLTPTKIKAIALDSNTRYVSAVIRDRGGIYDVGQNTSITLTVMRPDKVGVQIVGETVAHTETTPDEQTITTYGAYAELSQVALAIKGTLRAQFKLVSGEQILRTEIFTINNGEALDATIEEWAGDMDGHNLDEMAEQIEDAAAAIEDIQGDVSELKDGLQQYEDIFTGDVDESVQNWLEKHPEATTTVQDGSLTLPKFKDGELPFVTPEQFGAKGDGVVDDTVAMSTAFNSGFPVALTKGKEYYVTSVDVTNPLVVYGNGAKISTKCGNTSDRMIILRTSAETAWFYDVDFYTTVGVSTQGAHGETINNRSKRIGISAYGLNKLYINNCAFDGFDETIVGQIATEDTQFSDALETLIVENTSITNTLVGISRTYKNVWVNNCNIQVDKNAQSGEHCIYLLSDVLENAIIESTVCDASESASGATIQFWPANGDQVTNIVNGTYLINNCVLRGDAFINITGGGICKATGSSMEIINYNTTNRRRQFNCPTESGSVLYIDNCNVDYEMTDPGRNVFFNSCVLHSERLMSDRFSITEAINCTLENIGIMITGSEKLVNCIFSSPKGIAGNYYFSVASTASGAYIANCIFRSGENATSLSYNTQGSCTVVSPISSLPVGTNTSSITVINKIDAL